MTISEEFEFDRLRVKFPRTYKALVTLYPGAWDQMLAVIEPAMECGKTASVVVGRLSILRGLDRDTRRWVMLSLQADRREIMLRQQRSFLTQLHDKTLHDIMAELNALEHRVRGATPAPPMSSLLRGHTFISHHAKTSGQLGLRLAVALESLGETCWIAPRNVPDGSIWNHEVYGAVQRCGAVVLLCCEGAIASRSVAGEVAIAMARKTSVLVVRVADVDPAIVHVALAAHQYSEDWIGPCLSDVSLLAQRLRVHLSGVVGLSAA